MPDARTPGCPDARMPGCPDAQYQAIFREKGQIAD
jgi:hypothetical protein